MEDKDILTLNLKNKELNKNFNLKIEYKDIIIIYKIFAIIIINIIIDVIIIKLYFKKYQINYTNFNNEEYLQMCYKSRALFYTKYRKIKMKSHNLNFNYSNLITIQEKLNYLLIHESPDYKSKIADKIKLHDYSIKVLGKDICVPILKIYKNENEINLNELPDKFVLKCNHGSAMNIICSDKSKFDINLAKKRLALWKNKNYGFDSSEFQYINIKREIFAETYLKENIEDYKIYCFHGEPKFIRVQKKYIKNYKINNYYDINWKLTDIETGLPHFIRKPEVQFQKPINFDMMIYYAKKLSKEFAFVRVDFYNLNGTIYLGELTFTPSNLVFKLKNKNQSINLGNLININKIKNYLYN